MTKQDLKTGMQVTLRNGQRYLVLRNAKSSSCGEEDVLTRGFDVTAEQPYFCSCGFIYLTDYNNDLREHNGFKDYDIVEVYLVPLSEHCDTLHPTKKIIWKREQEQEKEKEPEMENYVVIDGKKIELTKKQIEQLKIENKSTNIFEPEENDTYYYINTCGGYTSTIYCNDDTDNRLKEVGNCCTSRDFMEQRAYQETLNRLLWRFSMENGMENINWTNMKQQKFNIIYDFAKKEFCYFYACADYRFGTIYFISEEVAREAVEKIVIPFMESHPDFNFGMN